MMLRCALGLLGCISLSIVACAADPNSEEVVEFEGSALCGSTFGVTVDAKTSTLRVPGGEWEGFGTQYNDRLHDYALSGVAPSSLPLLEERVSELGAQHVRIFLHDAKPGSLDFESFDLVAQMAESAGATINLTWAGGGTEPAFPSKIANALYELLVVRGRHAIRFLSIGNEINRTDVSKSAYIAGLKGVDAALRAKGIREKLKIIAPDVTRGRTEGAFYKGWVRSVAEQAGDVVDGYSLHVYWQYIYSSSHTDDDALGGSGILLLENAAKFFFGELPPAQRRPVYLNEFGARGYAPADGSGAWPGFRESGCSQAGPGCTPFESTVESALHTAWFDVRATRLGFSSALKWDGFQSRYGADYNRRWGMIGDSSKGWPRMPSFHLTKLLSRATEPGSHPVTVKTQGAPGFVATAALSRQGQTTLLILNRANCSATAKITGMPGALTAWLWNHPSAPKALCKLPLAKGKLTLPARSVAAIANHATELGDLAPCK